jgi:hypothetical protein
MSARKLAIVLFIFILPFVSLKADSFWNNLQWSFNGSLVYFPTNNGIDADPSPIIPTLGFSAALPLFPFLRIELTEDIYFMNYEYNTTLGYPMPSNAENRSAFVLGFVTGLQLTIFIPFGSTGMGIRLYGGPVIDIRLVFTAIGLNHPSDFTGNIETDAKLQAEAISRYFWSNARWFMPVFGMGMDFPANERFLLGLDFRVWVPVYRFSSTENSPSVDGWRFGAGFRITPRRNN